MLFSVIFVVITTLQLVAMPPGFCGEAVWGDLGLDDLPPLTVGPSLSLLVLDNELCACVCTSLGLLISLSVSEK